MLSHLTYSVAQVSFFQNTPIHSANENSRARVTDWNSVVANQQIDHAHITYAFIICIFRIPIQFCNTRAL